MNVLEVPIQRCREFQFHQQLVFMKFEVALLFQRFSTLLGLPMGYPTARLQKKVRYLGLIFCKGAKT